MKKLLDTYLSKNGLNRSDIARRTNINLNTVKRSADPKTDGTDKTATDINPRVIAAVAQVLKKTPGHVLDGLLALETSENLVAEEQKLIQTERNRMGKTEKLTIKDTIKRALVWIDDDGFMWLYNYWVTKEQRSYDNFKIVKMGEYLSQTDAATIMSDASLGYMTPSDNYVKLGGNVELTRSAPHARDFFDSDEWADYVQFFAYQEGLRLDENSTPGALLSQLFDHRIEVKNAMFEAIMKSRGIETNKSREERANKR